MLLIVFMAVLGFWLVGSGLVVLAWSVWEFLVLLFCRGES